ncbi:MAG: type 2 isopentenyl-diphosphate Delta-isomerase [Pseudobdellovibrionaceae bacterium]
MSSKTDHDPSFEQRKKDHIRIALSPETQTASLSGFDKINLHVDGLPNLNFSDVTLESNIFGSRFSSPFFISSMTAGHSESIEINDFLAGLSTDLNIFCGVGSQRKEIDDTTAQREWKTIRKSHPKAKLLGNLGASQLVRYKAEKVLQLIENIEAFAFFIHFNSLQEVLQPEGTPDFSGALDELARLIQKSPVPIIVKEVGSGFSQQNMKTLDQLGVAAIDVAGLGGTHWGRVEGLRSKPKTMLAQTAETFSKWGKSTADCLIESSQIHVKCQIWASGGIRNGLDGAKMSAMGAKALGLAMPWMKIFTEHKKHKRTQAARDFYELLCYEMKVALFCTGSKTVSDLKGKAQWKKNPQI